MANNQKPPKLPALPDPFRLAPKLPLQATGSWNSKRAILHFVFHLVESERQKNADLRYCHMECLAMAVLGQDTIEAVVMARVHVQQLIRDLNAYDPNAPLLIPSRGKYTRCLTVHFDTGRQADLALAYVERLRVQARADRALTLVAAMEQKQENRPVLVSPI